MSLKKIEQKINDETKQQIDALVNDQKKAREQVRKEHKARLEAELRGIKTAVKARIERMRKSSRLRTEMDRKIRILRAKTEAFENIFTEAEKEMSAKHLEDLYCIMLQKISHLSNSKGTRILVSIADLELTKKIITREGLGFKVEADDKIKQGGGMVAEFKDFSMDYTISSMFKDFINVELENVAKLYD